MTCEEAIYFLDGCKHHCDNAEMIDIAIKALEKQIFKKPIYDDFDDVNDNGEIKPTTAICPVCGYEFEYGDWNEHENPYCKCGQKINWTGYGHVDSRDTV